MEEEHKQTPTRWEWFQEKAKSKHAEWWLGTYSFFETVILPFPTDPFLAVMVLVNRSRALWLTFWTTLTSFLGSVFLYGVTVFFYHFLVEPLVVTFGMESIVAQVSAQVSSYTFVTVLFGAFSPFPYTPVVIAAGLLRVDFIAFCFGAFLGRALRYTLVSVLTLFFGVTLLKRVGRIATVATVVLVAIAALYFLIQLR